MKYLNLGCGTRYLETWDNLDFVSPNPAVRAHNFLNGIPFPENSYDVVYHSHLLEHLPKDRAAAFVHECFRVLKKGGVIRVVVPDLEQVMREYLRNLDGALAGDKEAAERYEWIVIEMMDQMVRQQSGGTMLQYWARDNVDNEAYVASRVGYEYLNFRKKYLAEKSSRAPDIGSNPSGFGLRSKLIVAASGEPKAIEYMQIGKFRSFGEIHQWMYDQYSLGKLLTEAGFSEPKKLTAFTSNIVDWPDHQWLDVEEGNIRKPESLFMEAIK